MNNLLMNKLDELKNAKDYECWYLVKQTTSFVSLCYLVSFLKKYKDLELSKSIGLQEYISQQVSELKSKKTSIVLFDNYRALRVAAFFGLIIMNGTNYVNADITETYYEILARCNGIFENETLYRDIEQRQIEKMYISSEIDEQSNEVRKDFRLYPIMLLYKILLELGRASGKYSISMIEYRYLVATTKKFEDFLDTLSLIQLLRKEPESNATFDSFKAKFDNRMILAIKQLDTLIVDNDSIVLKDDCVSKVDEEVFKFEQNPNIFATSNYLNFLGSTKSLLELKSFETEFNGNLDNTERNHSGVNVILYGVPGSGKSFTIQKEYCSNEKCIERVVFHPDYTYSDFVGQILPSIDGNGNVSYKFAPGPFTKILKSAYFKPKKDYYLIIEEINRGNAPAIFGDIFQLLDRLPDGTSAYGITNSDIAMSVYGYQEHPVKIPSNLSILCTMNTSDQNVFTLDTAFQRRWDMRLIENSFKKETQEEIDFAEKKILDSDITWENFCEKINSYILQRNITMTSAEDKRLGTHFILSDDLTFDSRVDEPNATQKEKIDAIKHNNKFPEKVIKYLWDDAFKFNRIEIFDTGKFNSLESIIHEFCSKRKDDRFDIFVENIKNDLETIIVNSENSSGDDKN